MASMAKILLQEKITILTKNYTSYFAPKVLQFLFLCLKGITNYLKQSHKANNIRKDLFTRLMIV